MFLHAWLSTSIYKYQRPTPLMRLFCYYYSESPDYNFCLPNCGNYILYLNKIIIRHDINTIWYLYIHKFSVLRLLGITLTKLKRLIFFTLMFIYFKYTCSYLYNILIRKSTVSRLIFRLSAWLAIKKGCHSRNYSWWGSTKVTLYNENRSRYQYMILSPGL